MPPKTAKTPRSLEDYVDLLKLLSDEGLSTIVIGGCAVGAYARMIGETALSGDLDLYANRETQRSIVRLVINHGARLRKLPGPRSVPVVVFDWHGKEVDVLTETVGLHSPDLQAQVARVLELKQHAGLTVLLANPFDLLANKLSVNREKDQPHIEILRSFLEQEVVYSFRHEENPRQRIDPARRLLQVTRRRVLEESLAVRLVDLARTSVDFRFLMQHVSTRALAEALLARAPPEQVEELSEIRSHRRFPTSSRP